MQLSIGSVICELRKEKRITQEQLANAVGVSTPAVSKWETGSTYPDITLLSPIARFLGTTVDALLSFENELTEEQVLEIIRKCSYQFITEDFDSAVASCDEYSKQYPNSPFLKYNIAVILQINLFKADNEEKRKQTIQKAISLLEASVQSEELKTRLKSLSLLSSLYMTAHEFEKADAALKEIPKVDVNPDILFPSLYQLQGKFEEAQKLNQQNLLNEIYNSVLTLTSMVQIAISQKQMDYALKLAQTQQKLIENFELENIIKIMNCHLFVKIYAVSKDEKSVLDYLEEYIDYIIKIDIDSLRLFKSEFFNLVDSFNTVDLKKPSDYANFTKKHLVDIFRIDIEIDFVRDTDRYRSLVKKLEDAL